METEKRTVFERFALRTASAHMGRRRFLALSAGLASAGLLAACGGSDGDDSGDDSVTPTTQAVTEPTPTVRTQIAPTAVIASSPASPTAAAGNQPKKGGTITIGLNEEPQSMDNYIATAPSSGVVYDNIFNEIAFIGADGKITPGLAKSWELMEPTRWRLKIQDNAKWHTGEKVTAEDLKFHFDRIFNKEKPGRPAGLTPGVDHAEVVDATTFDIVTKVPYPLLINDLVPRYNVISSFPKGVQQHGDQYGQNPTGNGPFKFSEWKQGQSITLEAYDDYWEGRPYLDKVVFRFIKEESARLLALENGEIDFCYGLPRHEVKRLEDDDNFKVLKSVTFVTQYLEFNANHPLFQDARVRNAIGYAIDKNQIVETAFEGQAQAAEEIISPVIQGYDSSIKSGWPFDLDRAKALLAEAGWADADGDGILEKDGEKFSVEYSYAPGTRYPEEVSTVLQAQLKKAGIDFQLRKWESSAILTEYPKGTMAVYAYAQGLATGHYGQLGFVHFHSTGGRNYNFLYKNDNAQDKETTAKLDQILADSQSEFDAAKRQELWKQSMQINREQALLIPLYYPFELGATSAKVMDAYVHPGEYLRMKRVWLDE